MFLAINSFLTRLLTIILNYLEQVSVEVIPPQSTDRKLSLVIKYIRQLENQQISQSINHLSQQYLWIGRPQSSKVLIWTINQSSIKSQFTELNLMIKFIEQQTNQSEHHQIRKSINKSVKHHGICKSVSTPQTAGKCVKDCPSPIPMPNL